MHRRKRETSAALVVISDILLTVVILGIYFLFQVGIPAVKSSMAAQKQAAAATPSPVVQTAEPAAAEVTAEPVQETAVITPAPTAEPTPEPTPDTRTPWQIRFEDYFTDEVVQTENSYSSPNVAIRIDTISTGEGGDKITYHVADVHIASIDCFRTYVSHGVYSYFDTQEVMEMDAAVNALLSISGDFCTYQQTGFLVRNGEVIRGDQAWCDICVLYADGTMKCYVRGTYTNDQVMADGALQVWNFGPSLLNDAGEVRTDYTVSQTVMYPNPRSAVGYYEPGHYCLVIVDGRQEGYSKGMLLNELGELFHSLGCTCAYNLDGGGSAVMTFNHDRYSQQSNGADRMLGDILYICEPEEQ